MQGGIFVVDREKARLVGSRMLRQREIGEVVVVIPKPDVGL